MFISNSERRPHAFINKQFKLTVQIRNMAGTFTKGSVLTCVEVRGVEGEPRAVVLEDEKKNQLLLNAVDFIKSCKAVN